jgi:spore coat polysaccharide biosynthesis predicted glycosyltransferase SpsG
VKFCICLESSHARGMGHLFRALNLATYFNSVGEYCLILLNRDQNAERVLQERNISYRTVELRDTVSNWEADIVRQYGIEIWINDRQATERRHAEQVTAAGARLIVFDDTGNGAELADIHFAAIPCMARHTLAGKRVLTGIEYLILNREIDRFKRERKRNPGDSAFSLVVSIGGSDTYGVTLRVLDVLAHSKIPATVIAGPSFEHYNELDRIDSSLFTTKSNVSSLIEEFYSHDLAITAGGLTPFEANASGLPCIIVATEQHEILNAEFLAQIGSSVHAGYYQELDYGSFDFNIDCANMSKLGLSSICTRGAENVYREITGLY